jgi:hypothetical protein
MSSTLARDNELTPLRGVVQDKAPLADPGGRLVVAERREHDGRSVWARQVGSRRPLRTLGARH